MKNIERQCTTLEQSKKLKELGFTKDSASLVWENFSRIGMDIDERLWAIGIAGCMHPVTTHLKLPCWTIADMIILINYNEPMRSIEIMGNAIYVVLPNNDYNDFDKSNLRDNLFDCLVWLKENKYL